ncbi:MAG: SAM-dependent methyltransferase [Marmoricola sp.]|nr:SAM-dependent methyltransferase [Marmoricola sp.]
MTEIAPQYPDTVAALRAAGCVYAEDEARLILDDGRGVDELVARRVLGEPLEWVLGWVEFGGLRLVVRPGVFVPRRRTELVADLAVAHLPEDSTAVDLCCGSGALGAVLRSRRAHCDVYSVDIDPVAVACARENLPDATVLCGDLFAPLPGSLRGSVDAIVANTPYVPSDQVRLLPPEAREHEPLHTLDGGPDGLALLRRISAEAPGWLRTGGRLLIEISEGQWDTARTAYEAAGLNASCQADEDTCVAIGELPAGVRSAP